MKNKKKVSSAPKEQKVVAKKPEEVSKVHTNEDTGNSKIRPLGDRILIRPFSVEETEKKNNFGIIIPDTVDKASPEQGEVLAVGEGRYIDGKIVPIKVKVGDTVIFSKYGFDEVKVGGEELYILREDSILAVIK